MVIEPFTSIRDLIIITALLYLPYFGSHLASQTRNDTTCSHNRVVSPADARLDSFLNSGTGKVLNIGNTIAEDVIATAMKYLGTPHCLGGRTSACLDCSGLLAHAFGQNDIPLTGSSDDMARYGQVLLKKTDLRRGDLLFFRNTFRSANYITHSAIYLGDNQFIHTSSRFGVTITALTHPWWKRRFAFGTRVFSNNDE